MIRYRYLRFPGGKDKAVTLSYDDGVSEDLRFSDIISEAGLKCTFNLNCDVIRENNITKETADKYYFSRGHEVAVHGELHKAEGIIRPISGIKDVLNCRLELEKKFGRIIRGMAYPDSGIRRIANGTDYERIKHYLVDLDVAYSRTLGGDNNSFELPDDWHAWMPTAKHTNPQIFEYIDEFLEMDVDNQYGPNRSPKLFYMWGHTYEFTRDNNWDLIETIADKLGNRSNIWYATNIEIYEYTEAYNRLVYSADETLVYNPTLYEIWFDIDKKVYKIKPGETLKIEN